MILPLLAEFYYCSEVRGLELLEAARQEDDYGHPMHDTQDMSSST